MSTNCPSTHWICDVNNIITLISIVYCLFVIILMSFHAFQYFQYRKHIALRKRYANITIFVYVCQTLKSTAWIILLVNNLLWYDKWSHLKYIGDHGYNHQLLWKIIRIPVTYGLYFSFIFGWIARFWMSNYTIHLTKQSLQSKWQSIINANIPKNWYIKHKNTLGNLRFISVLITVLLVIIVSVLSYYSYQSDALNLDQKVTYASDVIIGIEIFSSVAAAVILYGIYLSIPVLDDNFFIYEELKRLLYVLMFGIIPLWLLGILLEAPKIDVITVSMKINDNKHYIASTIYEMLCETAQVIGVLVTTYWINTKISPIINQSKYRLRHKDSIEYVQVVSSKFSINLEPSNKSGLLDSQISHVSGSVISGLSQKSKNAFTHSQSKAPNNFSELLLRKTSNSNINLNLEVVHDRSEDSDKEDSLQYTMPHEVQQETMLYVDMTAHKTCFEEFVLYLSKDYCIENMLGFIEMIQFQQYIFDYIIQHPDKVEMHTKLKISLHKNCEFPKRIPKSLIVFGDQNNNNIKYGQNGHSIERSQESLGDGDSSMSVFVWNGKMKAFKIYKKYVMNNEAEYLIDVSDHTRAVLDNWVYSEHSWMNNSLVDIEDLLDMFDDCVDECFAILSDSYKRFMLTEIYEKLIQTNVQYK